MSVKRRTRRDLLESLDTIWIEYPRRLQQLPDDEQMRFAQQQGYARPQDLLAHLGAWMEETLRVMPYLQRDWAAVFAAVRFFARS